MRPGDSRAAGRAAGAGVRVGDDQAQAIDPAGAGDGLGRLHQTGAQAAPARLRQRRDHVDVEGVRHQRAQLDERAGNGAEGVGRRPAAGGQTCNPATGAPPLVDHRPEPLAGPRRLKLGPADHGSAPAPAVCRHAWSDRPCEASFISTARTGASASVAGRSGGVRRAIRRSPDRQISLPMATAVSAMRFEKPHSLSYQVRTRHEGAVHHLGLVHVEDRGVRVVVEVRRDELLGRCSRGCPSARRRPPP